MRREGLSLRAEVRGWYCPSPSPKILKGHPTHTPHISNNSSPASKGKHPWPGNQGVLLLSPRCLSHELESVGTIAILRGVRGGNKVSIANPSSFPACTHSLNTAGSARVLGPGGREHQSQHSRDCFIFTVANEQGCGQVPKGKPCLISQKLRKEKSSPGNKTGGKSVQMWLHLQEKPGPSTELKGSCSSLLGLDVVSRPTSQHYS